MKKLLSLLLVLALCVGLIGCGATTTEPAVPAEPAAPAEPVAPAEPAAPAKEDVVILYTNDVHTYIDGVLSYDVIAAIKNDLETQ